RGLRPTALVELVACSERQQVEPVELEPPLAAVCDSVVEVPSRSRVKMLFDGDRRKRDVAVRDVLRSTRLASPVLRSFVSRQPLEPRQCAPGVDRDLVVAEGLGDRDRAACPLATFLLTRSDSAQERPLCIRSPELAPGRQLLEDLDGFPRPLLGLGDAARAPEKLGEVEKIVALFELVAEAAPKLDRLLESRNTFVVLIREVAGSRPQLEDLRSPFGIQALAEAQRAGVLRRCLPVCAERSRAPRA